VLVNAGGCSWRALAGAARPVARETLVGGSRRLATVVGFGDFFATSPTTASVSCTDRSGAVAAGAWATGACATGAGAGTAFAAGDIAAAGVGTVFCRDAR
jgi:hypothetical protein